MELLLIRHALPIRREVEVGAADPELSADGHLQAQHLGQYLASEHLDAVYSSPMQRARQTAVPVAEGRDLEIVVEDDVAEYDLTASAYVPVEELKAANDPRWQQMLSGEWDGEEPQEEFNERTVKAIERIIGDHGGGRVAIVCHGGVINAYLTNIIGLDPMSRGFFYPNYTSIHRVAASSRGHRSIVTINETSHLRGTGLPMGMIQNG